MNAPTHDAQPLDERIKQVLKRAGNSGINRRWMELTRERLAEEPFQRDLAFLEKLLPMMELWSRYFDAEVRGLEKLPKDRPLLLVGNHSGGMLTPDTTALIASWYRTRGLEDDLVGLAFDSAFAIPGLGDIMRKIGQVPANRDNAASALRSGRSVLVYPGGAYEVYRPWKDRNRIVFHERKGFIKLALQEGIPVVPVVGHGGHETLMVLSRGERVAALLGYDQMRLETMPVMLQFPWGLSTPAFPSLPLPAKINVEVGAPIDWSHLGPEAAEDPDTLDRCYAEITNTMQGTLDRMAADNPRPLLSRLGKLISAL